MAYPAPPGVTPAMAWLAAAALFGADVARAAPDETPEAGAPVDEAPAHRTRVVGPAPEADATLGRGDLRRDAVMDLGRALEGTEGLRIVRLGGLGAFSTVSIRGSTAEQVMVLLDGIPLGGADGGPVDLGTLPLGPLAAVDLHRNFTPARFGVPALAGAIDLRSRTADLPEASAELGAGSFSTRLLRARVGAHGFSADIDVLGSEGDFRFVDDAGTRWTDADDTRRTRRNNASGHVSGLLRGAFDLTPELRLSLLWLGTSSERELPGLGVHPTTESRTELRRDVAGLTLTADLAATELRLAAHLAATETAVTDPLGELGPPRPRDATTSLVPGVTLTAAHAFGPEEAPLRAELHAAWRAENLGGDRAISATRHLLTAGTTLSLAVPAHRLRLQLDAQLLIPLSDVTETGGEDAPVTGRPGAAALAISDAARLSVSLSPARGHRLGLTATRSFRLPSLYERFGDTGLTLGNPGLSPERAHGLELSWHGELLRPSPTSGHALSLELQVFSRWHEDLIQFLQNAQNVARPDNIASALIAGAELGLSHAHGDMWNSRLGISLLHTRDTSSIAARSGRPLPLRPLLSANARVRFAPTPRLGVAVDLHAMSANTLDPAGLVRTAPRLLAGAHVDTRIGEVAVVLSVVNLFGSTVQDLAGFPLPGLSAFASLRWESAP